MIIKDRFGKELAVGDEAVISMNNELVSGTVVRIDTGVGTNIAAQNGQVAPAQPMVFVQLFLANLAMPDGTCPTLIKGKPAAIPDSPKVSLA